MFVELFVACMTEAIFSATFLGLVKFLVNHPLIAAYTFHTMRKWL